VRRLLGVTLNAKEIAGFLERLGFNAEIQGEQVLAVAPDHRLDIGEGITGSADLIEEVARVYGYDNIPETRLADGLPPQRSNPSLEREERLRDVLVNLGLQEVINYRLTSPEREARLRLEQRPYVRLANPIAIDRAVLRQSVLSSVMEVVERNVRLRERIALFEIGPAFFQAGVGELPEENQRLAMVLAGPRAIPGWQPADNTPMDFYDIKGLLSAALDGLRIPDVRYVPDDHPTYHPGKCARVMAGEQSLGLFGELHPLVRERYDMPISYAAAPLLGADLDLQALLELIPARYDTRAVPEYPPVLEDLALIVPEELPAEHVEQVMRAAGGSTLERVRLFDVYRGEQIGAGMKSLAYSLTYQAVDRTLTDNEAAQIRQRIVRRLEQELGAKLRGE